MADRLSAELLRRLRDTAGLEVKPGEPLARYTTFRIGGPAELLVAVASERALRRLLAALDGAPCQLLGLGSNVLIPDEGLPGVVLRLVGGFRRVRLDGTAVEAGGAVALGRLARRTAAASLSGLEALAGFPSTVGGAVYMNAGSYGTEICDVLEWATVVERDGRRRRLTVAELEPSYRRTALQGTGAIVTRARFALAAGDRETSLARIEELTRRRWASLPSGRPNAGSVFRNPEGGYAGRLIEQCGLKGRSSGGALISPQHGNVIVNQERASADDVLELMLLARREVKRRFDVELEPELVLTGSLAQRWRRASA
ncbi:MAG: UDP-N-acetylmuramate dehydrogenase [Thermoanaerobaculia bacterium]